MTDTMPAAAETGGSFVFDAANQGQVKAIIAKYPPGRQASALLPLLHLAQRQNGGWLPQSALDYIAGLLEMAPIRVYEVATFYTMYNLKPVGRHHLEVCTNLACWLRGSDEIIRTCKEKLGIEIGETTADGMFTLSEAECLGACVNAPMAQIGDDYYEDLSPESMAKIIDQLRAGETPKAGSQIGRRSCEPAGALTSLTSLSGEQPHDPVYGSAFTVREQRRHDVEAHRDDTHGPATGSESGGT